MYNHPVPEGDDFVITYQLNASTDKPSQKESDMLK